VAAGLLIGNWEMSQVCSNDHPCGRQTGTNRTMLLNG
jgi:hypothetical protein